MTKKCRDCFAPVGPDGYRCEPCAQQWAEYTAAYIAARDASGGKGWEHADCDHAYNYCTQTSNNVFQPEKVTA